MGWTRRTFSSASVSGRLGRHGVLVELRAWRRVGGGELETSVETRVHEAEGRKHPAPGRMRLRQLPSPNPFAASVGIMAF